MKGGESKTRMSNAHAGSELAESQGFEPWTPFGALVFETSSLNRSDNSPRIMVVF